jgi:hypothetical protein
MSTMIDISYLAGRVFSVDLPTWFSDAIRVEMAGKWSVNC